MLSHVKRWGSYSLLIGVGLTWTVGIAVAQDLLYGEVKPIIDRHCVGCHDPNGAAFFLPFRSLDEIKGNEAAMVSAIEDDYMPMGAVPGFKESNDGRLLLEWLQTGRDLSGEPVPEEPHILMRDPRELRYADVKPIIDRACVGCHNPRGRMSRKPFDTLAGIRRHSDDMWEVLDEGEMPLSDREFRFSADGRALIGWLRYAPDAQRQRRDEDRFDDD